MPDHWELAAKAVSRRRCSPGATPEGGKFILSWQVKPGDGKGGGGGGGASLIFEK